MVNCAYKGVIGLEFPNLDGLQSLNIGFILANRNVDPDNSHCSAAAFNLGI